MATRNKDQIDFLSSLSQTVAAKLIGLPRTTLSSSDAPRLPSGNYDGPALVAWALARERLNATSDPMLTGGDSPNLERYRAAKAELAEMDAGERRAELVAIDELIQWWLADVAGPIKKAIEQLPEDGRAIMTAALERAIEAVDGKQPDTTPDAPQ